MVENSIGHIGHLLMKIMNKELRSIRMTAARLIFKHKDRLLVCCEILPVVHTVFIKIIQPFTGLFTSFGRHLPVQKISAVFQSLKCEIGRASWREEVYMVG